MPATDPARQLARELADLRREVRSQSRGSQASLRSLEINGETVSLPTVVLEGRATQANAVAALTAANGKNTVTFAPSSPTGPGVTEGDIWWHIDPVTGVVVGAWSWDEAATDWAPHTFGDGVMDSLSVAKLVAGEIAVGQRISAGPTNGTHAEMADTGFRVFAEDPLDGVPNEVARMGTTSNDYFAIVDADGDLSAAIDDTGRGTFTDLFVSGDPTLGGRKLSQREWDKPWGLVAVAQYSAGSVGGVSTTSKIGIINCAFTIQPGRAYRLSFEDVNVVGTGATSMEYGLRLVATTGSPSPAPAPSVDTTLVICEWSNNFDTGRWLNGHANRIWYGGSPSVPTECRLLLYMHLNTAFGGTVTHNAFGFPTINVEDVGPQKPFTGGVDRGGGSTPTPLRQYDSGELASAGWLTFNGSGTQRTDTAGPVQGYDPSGFNGNGKGFWYWNLPSITGTVDRVDVYLYSDHWYYNSGGTARLNVVPLGGSGSNFLKGRPDWDVGGFPKPGGKWVTLPADWNPLFHNNGAYGYARASAISVGPGPGTDLNYYGRFNGAARLRIWYTQ